MNEILALKQELLLGNFDEACNLVEEIEIMTRQDRINLLETNLALVISSMILIQVITSVDSSLVKKLRNCLIEIEQYNRLGNSFYIQSGEWSTHYENSINRGILKAIDTGLLPEGIVISKLTNLINYKILQIEVLGLISCGNSLNACELDDYLRQRFICSIL